MYVYRISDCRYINDLSGKGAAMFGGRWNNKDTHILYTAQSASLALLEAIVHLGKMPRAGYCMAMLEVPESIAPGLKVDTLPHDWASNPGPDSLKHIGDTFVRENKFLALPVPSVVMPEEVNYLINPSHALFKTVRIHSVKPFSIDSRIFKASA